MQAPAEAVSLVPVGAPVTIPADFFLISPLDGSLEMITPTSTPAQNAPGDDIGFTLSHYSQGQTGPAVDPSQGGGITGSSVGAFVEVIDAGGTPGTPLPIGNPNAEPFIGPATAATNGDWNLLFSSGTSIFDQDITSAACSPSAASLCPARWRAPPTPARSRLEDPPIRERPARARPPAPQLRRPCQPSRSETFS